MDISALSSPVTSVGSGGTSGSLEGLGSADFLKLLVTQLLNQDPLEPTDNEQLLRQISSIREIELSTTLTESLGVLTGQQRFSSVSTLIGQHVTSLPGADGTVEAGTVVGVRFETEGAPLLVLSNGAELAFDQVATIEPPLRVAEALIGKTVVGLDRRSSPAGEVIEGVVTGTRVDSNGEIMLELDTGEDLRFRDFVSLAEAA